MANTTGSDVEQAGRSSARSDKPKRRRQNAGIADSTVGEAFERTDDKQYQTGGASNRSDGPTGTAQAETASHSQASVEPVKPKRVRRTKAELDALKGVVSDKAKADARQLAEQLTMIANTIVMTALGPEAAMNETEKVLIDIGLPPMLEHLSPEQAVKFVALANPVILLFGVGVWGLRLSQLAEVKIKASKASKPKAIPVAVQPANGKVEKPAKVDMTPSESGFGVEDGRSAYLGDDDDKRYLGL